MKQDLAWIFQGGRRVTKIISSTAGNVNTLLSPGTGKRWLVLRGKITINTDATVANRYIHLRTTDGTNETEMIGRGNAVAASASQNLNFGEARNIQNATYGSGGDQYIGLQPVLLEGDDELKITVVSGQAGDNYSGYVVVLEVDV